jgi:exopolysaccharide biosynthesis polyprenyl glycosylphosphotransferase
MTAFANTGMPSTGAGDGSLSGIDVHGGQTAGRAAERQASKRVVRSTARSAINWSGRAWGAVDMLVAGASFALAHSLSPYHGLGRAPIYSVAAGAAVFAVAVLCLNYVLGGYDRSNFTSVGRMTGRVLAVNALAVAMTTVVFGWLQYVQIGRWVLLNTFLLSAGGTFACRLAARELARRSKVSLLFVGPRAKFRPLATRIRHQHRNFYDRPAYLDLDNLLGGRGTAARRAAVLAAFERHQPDEVVVMDGDAAVPDVLSHCGGMLRAGCAVHAYAAYYERLLGEIPVDAVDERGVLGRGFDVGSLQTGLAKRPMDVLLAVLGLTIGAPLMLAVALLVRLTSRGPVIYRQVRVGRYGKPFWIYKFRTMRTDAERDGAVWAKSVDSRVTPVGGFLRKTRFDELPQLWNILRGEMSLVGPRPERPEFVEQLKRQIPHYELRHLVPPGLTGWAQVRFRYGATVDDAQRKLAFDLYYVRHCGLAFDAAICLRTIAAMAKGAR